MISIDILRAKYQTQYSKFFEWNGKLIHYLDTHEGSETILMIHGINSSCHTWLGWIERLKSKYRCIAIDLPIFGLSDTYANLSTHDLVECIKGVLNSENIMRFHMVGNSMGGQIVLEYNSKYIFDLMSATLICSKGLPRKKSEELLTSYIQRSFLYRLGYFFPESMIRKAASKMYKSDVRMPLETQNRYLDMIRKEGYLQSFHQLWKSIGSPKNSQKELLAHLNCPSLILWGQQDHVIPVRYAYEFKELLPNSSLIIYPELGHIPMEENPTKTSEDFISFISNITF